MPVDQSRKTNLRKGDWLMKDQLAKLTLEFWLLTRAKKQTIKNRGALAEFERVRNRWLEVDAEIEALVNGPEPAPEPSPVYEGDTFGVAQDTAGIMGESEATA